MNEYIDLNKNRMKKLRKITFWLQLIMSFILVNICESGYVYAQQKANDNKYGLLVIKDITILQDEVAADSNKRMMNLRKLIPGILLDLKYATTNNFMHTNLYPRITTTYLRKPAADALKKVADELKQSNLGIKIFDAYRPYSVTEKMWEMIKDDRYVADPSKGSGHNRGVAVDLTIINLNTKKELPMGTGFDNFSDTAHQTFTSLPADILKNRLLLKTVMEKYGFVALDTEWWHFYLPNSSDYEVLDLTFSELKKLHF